MKTLLGIDFGKKRIGVALAVPSPEGRTFMALPFGVIENKSPSFVLEQLKEIISQEQVGTVVVGLPLPLSGQTKIEAKEETRKAVNQFVDLLKKELDIPIVTEDERLTTKEAESLTRDFKKESSASIDAIAAALILQTYTSKHFQSS